MGHTLTHLNWGGIAFVVLILPASAIVTEILRRWSNHRQAIEYGDPDTKLPEHVHIYSLKHSEMYFLPDGSAVLHCAVYSCGCCKVYPPGAIVQLRGWDR